MKSDMKFNEALAEKPDCGHYSACLLRMKSIDSYCRRCFGYTFAVCTLMIILTVFGMQFHVVSLIPSLFGDNTDVAHNFVQFLVLCAMIVMSGLAVGKRKIFGLILFVIYFFMALCCLFTNRFSDIFSFFIGLAGALLTFRFYSVHCDYVQLSQTEGFPIFNENLLPNSENLEHLTRYKDFDYDSAVQDMSEPEDTIQETEFTGDSAAPEMESLNGNSADSVKQASPSVSCRLYTPRCSKHCEMSESPSELSL